MAKIDFDTCLGNNRDIYFMTSAGLIENAQIVHKFGRNPAISSIPESIWDESTLYPWSAFASPSTLSIVSTSAEDKSGGTGAYTITVVGLDTNYDWLEEAVTLNGTTPVVTTNIFSRVFRMNVNTASTSNGAVGKLTASLGATVVASILIGNNQTMMGVFTIPRGYSGYITDAYGSVGQGKSATLTLFIRPFGGVFNAKHVAELYENTYPYSPRTYLKVPQKADIDVRAVSASAGTSISGIFNLIIVKDN